MFSVFFEVHPGEGRKDEYLGHAKELKPILESIDGFIDNERFESRRRPGWVLSHSTWRDEKSVLRWRTQAKHHLIQEKGRSEVFSDYHLRVGEITSDTHPPAGGQVREQRFDTTEIGESKTLTLVELDPAEGGELPKDNAALLRAVALDEAAAGLNDYDVFESIYNPGKVLVAGFWKGPHAAENFQPTIPSEAAALRRRSVRVIRDYGMYDRRETPQYYPDVERRD